MGYIGMGSGRSSAARLSVWLPTKGGGHKAKVTGGGPDESSDSKERPIKDYCGGFSHFGVWCRDLRIRHGEKARCVSCLG